MFFIIVKFLQLAQTSMGLGGEEKAVPILYDWSFHMAAVSADNSLLMAERLVFHNLSAH